MEVKEEPESLEEESSLVIDENFVSVEPSPEIPPPEPEEEVIAEVNMKLSEKDMKEEKIKRELDNDNDMGAFTDDDDVVFVGVEPDEERYNSTQSLIRDLVGLESNGFQEPTEPVPIQEQPVVLPAEEAPFNSTIVISDPRPSTFTVNDPQPPTPSVTDAQPATSRVADPQPSTSIVTDPKPSTSTVSDPLPSSCHPIVTAPPLDILEILQTFNIDTVLASLVKLYNIDFVVEKLKQLKGDSTDKKRKEKEKEKERTKKNDYKKSSSKHHDKKKESKHKKSPTRKEDSTFLAPSKVQKRRESYKDRSNSNDDSSKEKKPAPVQQRRKSTPAKEPEPAKIDHRRSSERKAEPQTVLPVVEKPHEISIEDHMEVTSAPDPPLPESVPNPAPPPAAPAPCEPPSPPADIMKSPEPIYGEMCVQAEKKRRLNDFSCEKMKPVPDPVPIEDIFSASQLPPPLDVVPEPKEPDFKFKLFDKKKVRVAHNKLTEKKDTKKESKEKEREAPKRKAVERKPSENYRIPLKSATRDPIDDLQSLLDQIDDATKGV